MFAIHLSIWRFVRRSPGLLLANIVVQDLRGWEDWKIDDADTIKGIAAELIASTGPGLLKDSALVLF